uniref:TYR_PHOSPHATASE_2 domain-containing protein n=1 Tax=Syphacia muris TaxID=451379 RepID=A0A0N5AI49_9BILA
MSRNNLLRWLKYHPIAKIVKGTRFIPFKTPLRQEYFDRLNKSFGNDCLFKVETLIQYVESLGKTLGLVIDLTATNRYYDPQLYDSYNIKYVKLACKGHYVDKDTNAANRFINIVSRFLHDNADNDNLIGVHCTHGINRTGFLICKYLIEVCGISPHDAIKS